MNRELLQLESVEMVKEMVFLNYFDKKVIDYPVSRNGQTVGVYLDFKDGRLNNHFETLKQKYGFKSGWEDLQSEYIFQAWGAIHKFTPSITHPNEAVKDKWIEILMKENAHEENKLIKYIKSTVGYKIYEFVNPNAFRTTTTKNGKKVHYTLVMDMESLDSLISDSLSTDSTPLQLTDENMLFDNTMYEYYITFFKKWFDKNKEEILTDSQIQFLENLKKCSNDIYLTAEEFEEVTGVKWVNYSRWLKRIEARIASAWKAENPTKQSRKQVYNNARVEYLEQFMTIADNEENLATQNLQLTDLLVKGMNNKATEYDVFLITNEALDGKRLVEFNRIVNNQNSNHVALDSKSLYMISEVIEEKLEKLKVEQMKEETVEHKLKKVRPKNKHRQLITYDKEGKVSKHEYVLETNEIIHKNIFYILPTGAETQQR